MGCTTVGRLVRSGSRRVVQTLEAMPDGTHRTMFASHGYMIAAQAESKSCSVSHLQKSEIAQAISP